MISNVLQYINEIDNAQIETTVSVCESMINAYQKAETIIEEYNGDDISAFTVFQEGYIMEADKMNVVNKKESTFMTIIKKIRDAIAKLFAMIFKRLGCNGFDPDKVGVVSTPQKINAEIKKTKKFHKEHPFLTGAAIAIGGTATVYGGSKAIDKIEKSVAWKELDQYERDAIKVMFEQDNGSLNFRYDINKILSVIKHLERFTPRILSNFQKSLYGSDDSNTKVENADIIKFAEKDGLMKVQSSLKTLCDYLDEIGALSFESEKTHCTDADDYNSKVKEFNESCEKIEELTKTIAAIDRLAFDVLAVVPQDSKAKKTTDSQYNKIAKYIHKITTIMNDITTIKEKVDADTLVLDRFLNRFYKVDRTVKDIKQGIRSAAETAAEIYNTATRDDKKKKQLY